MGELPAIKLGLGLWWHWLKWAKYPVIVWTDHKNLAYLQEANCLNQSQSPRSLFFSCFQFLIDSKSTELFWIEYTHNSHVSSGTGWSPLEFPWGYQSPHFSSNEWTLSVTSVQHHLPICQCRCIWKQIITALNHSAAQNLYLGNQKRLPAPQFPPGQKIWLSTRVMTLKYFNEKLSPRFIGPFEITSVLSPTSICLKPPESLLIHPVFHVSLIKPVVWSPLCPPFRPPPPARDLGGFPAFSIKWIMDVQCHGRDILYWFD